MADRLAGIRCDGQAARVVEKLHRASSAAERQAKRTSRGSATAIPSPGASHKTVLALFKTFAQDIASFFEP
jgi:hypothetical protein